MFPYLVVAIVIIGLPTIYAAVRFREYRKFLAGAFLVAVCRSIFISRRSLYRSFGPMQFSRLNSVACAGRYTLYFF